MAEADRSRDEREPILEAGAPESRSMEMIAPEKKKQAKCSCISLTAHQQRLIIVFVLWFCYGLYMYMSRPWGADKKVYTLVESIYIMVQIITTVGYGDYCPAEDGGFLFTSVYVMTAVGVLSSLVSAITEAVIETEDTLIKQAIGKVNMVELKQHIKERREQDSPSSAQGNASPKEGSPTATSRLGFLLPDFGIHPTFVELCRAILIWLLFVIAGVLFYVNYEGEEFELMEAIYMSIITLTTVGFGDKTPRTTAGRIFAIFWMLLGVTSFANMVAKFAAFSMAQDRIQKLDADTLLDIQADPFYRKNHPPSADGAPPKVTRADFVMFMMKEMGLLDSSVVETLSANFDELDKDGSGYLDTADINVYNERFRRANHKKL